MTDVRNLVTEIYNRIINKTDPRYYTDLFIDPLASDTADIQKASDIFEQILKKGITLEQLIPYIGLEVMSNYSIRLKDMNTIIQKYSSCTEGDKKFCLGFFTDLQNLFENNINWNQGLKNVLNNLVRIICSFGSSSVVICTGGNFSSSSGETYKFYSFTKGIVDEVSSYMQNQTQQTQQPHPLMNNRVKSLVFISIILLLGVILILSVK